MSARFPVGLLCAASAVALCSCGPASSPEKTTVPASPSLTATSGRATDTFPPTDVVGPAPTPTRAATLPPSDPLPGLVFTVVEADKGAVGPWLVEADGQSKQLSDKYLPALSPDRTQLLFTSYGDIWLSDFTTGKTRNLTKTRNDAEAFYQWWPAHPDLIVFLYKPNDSTAPLAGYLATTKPDGTNYLLLDEEVGSKSPPDLSPDGRSIAFDLNGRPWVYNFGAGKMPIFPKTFQEPFQAAVNPEWSPDSRQIAWQIHGLSGGANGSSATAVLSLDTMMVTLLHRYAAAEGNGTGYYHLAWSPSGEWLAAANPAELPEEGKISLWVMSPDGSEEVHLGPGSLPIWSPDGKMLVYSTEEGAFAVKAGEWNPFRVTLPETAQVIDWVDVE
jgi:Tol biopolymer transport system component